MPELYSDLLGGLWGEPRWRQGLNWFRRRGRAEVVQLGRSKVGRSLGPPAWRRRSGKAAPGGTVLSGLVQTAGGFGEAGRAEGGGSVGGAGDRGGPSASHCFPCYRRQWQRWGDSGACYCACCWPRRCPRLPRPLPRPARRPPSLARLPPNLVRLPPIPARLPPNPVRLPLNPARLPPNPARLSATRRRRPPSTRCSARSRN